MPREYRHRRRPPRSRRRLPLGDRGDKCRAQLGGEAALVAAAAAEFAASRAEHVVGADEQREEERKKRASAASRRGARPERASARCVESSSTTTAAGAAAAAAAAAASRPRRRASASSVDGGGGERLGSAAAGDRARGPNSRPRAGRLRAARAGDDLTLVAQPPPRSRGTTPYSPGRTRPTRRGRSRAAAPRRPRSRVARAHIARAAVDRLDVDGGVAARSPSKRSISGSIAARPRAAVRASATSRGRAPTPTSRARGPARRTRRRGRRRGASAGATQRSTARAGAQLVDGARGRAARAGAGRRRAPVERQVRERRDPATRPRCAPTCCRRAAGRRWRAAHHEHGRPARARGAGAASRARRRRRRRAPPCGGGRLPLEQVDAARGDGVEDGLETGVAAARRDGEFRVARRAVAQLRAVGP